MLARLFAFACLAAAPAVAHAASDLSKQEPIRIAVDLGRPGQHAGFKGAIREIEVYPGHTAKWWFVPVATGRVTDLPCGIVATGGKSHAEHGMVGEIVID